MQVSLRARVAESLVNAVSRTHVALENALARPWLRICLGLLICAIGVLRFVHLAADFPNDTPWMIDQAKFTDEGWWGSAGVMHALSGHWFVPGDYNPAVALPVWPLLLSAVFHFTGVSVDAARALNVSISLVTLGLIYLLVRHFTRPSAHLPAFAAVLLLVLSPFAFVFCRLAILDSLVAFEFSLSLLVASCATRRRVWPLIVLPVLISLMLLTKTTSAALIPAVLWLAWSAMGRKPIAFLHAALAVAVVPAAFIKGYAALAAALGYGADYKYFFSMNAMQDFVWAQAFATITQFLQNCFWIDRILFPVALVVLAITVAWTRKLWCNPLFAAAWLALAGQALFIIRRQDDYAPRYFLVMLAPVIWIVVLALDDALAQFVATPKLPHPLWNYSAIAAALLFITIAVSAVTNGIMVSQFVTQPEYQFYDAANSIREIIRSHPEQKPLILGVSGPQISLMTGILSINDDNGTEAMAQKLARYQPGWFLAWSDTSISDETYLSSYRLEKMASYSIFDDDERTPLTLYKMVRRLP